MCLPGRNATQCARAVVAEVAGPVPSGGSSSGGYNSGGSTYDNGAAIREQQRLEDERRAKNSANGMLNWNSSAERLTISAAWKRSKGRPNF